MGRAALRLVPPRVRTRLDPLTDRLPLGKLIEISGRGSTARMTTAVSIVRRAQQDGETTAWIQPHGGPLHPPDLALCGVDLAALVVIHVPEHTRQRGAWRAAELLLRSGAFGLLVLDLRIWIDRSRGRSGQTEALHGRLLALARQHLARVVLLTEKAAHADSLGTLVGLRIEPRRSRAGRGCFIIEHAVLKNKSGAPFEVQNDHHRGPTGLR